MKKPIIPALIAVALAAAAPSAALADFVLDTGTPSGTGLPAVLNSTSWYAAEFTVGAGDTTITSLSAYLTVGAGKAGDSFVWDLYSASGAFIGASSATREPVTDSTAGSFSSNGWNTTNVNWNVTPGGTYWIALEVTNSGQTKGLDLPVETSTGTGTVPATAFAFAGTTGKFQSTSTPVGIEVTAVPLPAAAWLLGSGLMGLIGVARRRRA